MVLLQVAWITTSLFSPVLLKKLTGKVHPRVKSNQILISVELFIHLDAFNDLPSFKDIGHTDVCLL